MRLQGCSFVVLGTNPPALIGNIEVREQEIEITEPHWGAKVSVCSAAGKNEVPATREAVVNKTCDSCKSAPDARRSR